MTKLTTSREQQIKLTTYEHCKSKAYINLWDLSLIIVYNWNYIALPDRQCDFSSYKQNWAFPRYLQKVCRAKCFTVIFSPRDYDENPYRGLNPRDPCSTKSVEFSSKRKIIGSKTHEARVYRSGNGTGKAGVRTPIRRRSSVSPRASYENEARHSRRWDRTSSPSRLEIVWFNGRSWDTTWSGVRLTGVSKKERAVESSTEAIDELRLPDR